MFENDDILKLKRNLDIQKAHAPDDISIRMIQIFDSALVKSLSLISKIVLIVVLFMTSGRNQLSALFTKKWQTNY